MYTKCCIENCESKRQDVKFHQFPTSDIGLKKWLECVRSVHLHNLSPAEIRKKRFVCHKHFESRFVTPSLRLRIGSYPTLFSDSEIASGSPSVDKENELDTLADHCYSKKTEHKDHSYSKKPADDGHGTDVCHVFREIGNLPQIQDPDSVANHPGPSQLQYQNMEPSLELVQDLAEDQLELSQAVMPMHSEQSTVLELVRDLAVKSPGYPNTLTQTEQASLELVTDSAENSPESVNNLIQTEQSTLELIKDAAETPDAQIEQPPLELVKDLEENSPDFSNALTQTKQSPLEKAEETNITLEEKQMQKRKRIIQKVKNLSPECKLIYNEYLRSKRQANFHKRAKRAMKFLEGNSFNKLTAKMNKMAKSLFWMQIKQSSKKLKGRRFTTDEKLISLSIMKQSPKCYRFLKRIFILPSKNTLNKMISNLKINPGINEQVFQTMKEEVKDWPERKKYCSIIFDEVSLQTGVTYDKSRDAINGFVELQSKTNQFADHALAFMIRGAVYKWQQPIAYYFCEGATKKDELKYIIKEIVAAVVDVGLLPVALISDQGSSFQSTLNSLAEDTRREQVKAGHETDGVISLSGQNLSIIYDPPHLIKGIRNNFLNKNISHEGKISKWSDIVDVYKADCNHAEVRLLHKLNDSHVLPNNINKMKVKNCTRVLSKTVAAALSYTSQFSHYSDGREVSNTLQNTSEIVSFFDDVFDSCNGSALRTKGKRLRRAVTEKSDHHAFWPEAIEKIQKMKFVPATESGHATRASASVPSLKNWVVTLKSMQRLWQFFASKGIKIMRTRNFNSDPIENFFGQVRAYNFRYNDPDCHNFTHIFRSLLITRFIKFHSEGFNCEEDSGSQIIKLKKLFRKEKTPYNVIESSNVVNQYLAEHNVQLEPQRERLHVHARAYTAGCLVGKILKKNYCDNCKTCLTTEKGEIHSWVSHREYSQATNKLNYPSEHAVRHFGGIVKITNEYLEKEPHQNNIIEKIKKLVFNRYSFNFIKCGLHRKLVAGLFVSITIRLTVFNWCTTINKILKGTDVMRIKPNMNLPAMTSKAVNKYVKKSKNKYICK